jgi:hypothetical protein
MSWYQTFHFSTLVAFNLALTLLSKDLEINIVPTVGEAAHD